jgi:hypothetical protein
MVNLKKLFMLDEIEIIVIVEAQYKVIQLTVYDEQLLLSDEF